jgi:hypothetical protein
MTELKWRRVGPQDYRATLPDGTEARVSGHYVDERGRNGDHGRLTGWQWGAQVDGNFVTDHWHGRMRDAKNAVQQHLDRAAADKGDAGR